MVSRFFPVIAVVVVDNSYVEHTMLVVVAVVVNVVDVQSVVVVDTEESVPWAEVFQLVSA